jgi:hypothetical protein
MSVPTKFGPEVIDRIVEQLAEGKSLTLICREEGMPTRQCVHNWMRGSEELAGRLLEAREIGFHLRAELAVAAAKACSDPIKGRLVFDAERWYLGKLSNAFAEKPVAFGVQVNVGAGNDAFAAIAGALDRAAAAVAGSGSGTRRVDLPSPPGPANTPRQLADLDGDGRERVGQDPDRS